jgi:putative transposase
MTALVSQVVKGVDVTVLMTKLCEWFGIPRYSAHYKPRQSKPKVQECFAKPVKATIEENPSFGYYRTLAHLLDFNKNTMQRVVQLMRWRVKNRPIGFWPSIQVLPSIAQRLNVRWTTNLFCFCTGRDGWAVLALMIDSCTRELLDWRLARSGKAKTADSTLVQALITHYSRLSRVRAPFLLSSDNGLLFNSRSYTALVRRDNFRPNSSRHIIRNRTA